MVAPSVHFRYRDSLMQTPTLPKVLIAEDDDAVRLLFVTALRNEPLEVHAISDGLDALRLAEQCEYAVVVLDLMMPVVNGFDFLATYSRLHPRSRALILVVTAFDERVTAKLLPAQVHALITKPFDILQLVAIIRECAHACAAATAPAAVSVQPLPALPLTGRLESL